MEITKEQKERILVLDPNFFKKDLEVGKWYKHTKYKNTICFKISNVGYGTWEGKWSKEVMIVDTSNWILATNQEVEYALIKEAKKRGYKKGNYICLTNKKVELYAGYLVSYNNHNNNLWIENGCVFQNGEWAEIIETITKAEAEKLLNKIII